MMKQGNNAIKSYMTFTYNFAGIRIQDSYITPVDWELSANLIVKVLKNKTKEELEYKASIIYQRLHFWLESNLQSIAMVNVGNEDDLYLANISSNITMYCPGNPSDDLIIQLLHSKLNALTEPELRIGEVRLKSSDTSLQYTFDVVDGDYKLPKTTEDYYTEGTCRDTIPWWERNDGFCFEFVKPEETDIVDEKFFEDIVDPMDEFEKIISEMADTRIGMVKEPARIVQVEKWKPRKVE